MGLTQSQKSLIERAQAPRGGELGVGLSDGACSFLVATIVRDLGLMGQFPEVSNLELPDFFEESDFGETQATES